MAMALLSGKFSRRALWSPPAAASLGVLSNCSDRLSQKHLVGFKSILCTCIEDFVTIFF